MAAVRIASPVALTKRTVEERTRNPIRGLRSFLIASGITVVCSVLVGVQPAGAGFPGANGKIAFTSDRDGNVEIYTMNLDGSAQTRVTDIRPGIYGATELPRWSPDGTKLVFDSLNRTIYAMNADGTELTALIGNNSSIYEHPSWSPSGSQIAFTSDQEGPPGFYNIYTMNADGTAVTRRSFGGADFFPAWSPDGSKIAFEQLSGGAAWISVMNVDGSGLRPLTDASTRNELPNWSPDGTKIAFTSNRDGNYEIYVMNADGSSQTRVTNSPGNDWQAAWSPDGTKIAFTSNRHGNYEIYVMNADGTSQTRVTNNPSIDAQPDWQPVAADTTPPILSLPSDIVTDATGPAGATVTYTASAADAVDGPVQVTCTPASGTIFPIGTTVVTCTATDTHGNASNGSFNVHVKGADEQLDDLLELVVTESLGPGTSLSDKLRHAQDALAVGDHTATCDLLNAFMSQVQAQFGKKLTPAQATELVDAANRIQAVLDC